MTTRKTVRFGARKTTPVARQDAWPAYAPVACPCGGTLVRATERTLACPRCSRSSLAGETITGPMAPVVWAVVGPDKEEWLK